MTNKRKRFYEIALIVCCFIIIGLSAYMGITAIQKSMKLNMSFQVNPSIVCEIYASMNGEDGTYNKIFSNVEGSTSIGENWLISGNTLTYDNSSTDMGLTAHIKVTNKTTGTRIMVESGGAGKGVVETNGTTSPFAISIPAKGSVQMLFSQVFVITKGTISHANITPATENSNVYTINDTYYVKAGAQPVFTVSGESPYQDPPAQSAITITNGEIYSYSNGTLILKALNSDATIGVVNNAGATFAVEAGALTGFEWGEGASEATFNTDYTFTLVLQDGYKIDGATVQAVIGGNTYDCSQTAASGTTYTFKLAGASITGNVTINAAAEEIITSWDEGTHVIYEYGKGSNVPANRAYYAENSHYKYYIEMGEYPQTMVSSADVTSLGLSTNLQKEGDYYKQGDNYYAYVGSPHSTYASGFTQWYKVEPVRWIVLGGVTSTTDGSSAVAFNPSNTLTYANGIFTYNNGSTNTEYSKVLLIAEQALKNNVYDSSSSDKAWQNTGIYSFLNTTLMPTIFTETQQNKILGTTLYTGRYSVGGNGGSSTLPNTGNGTSIANKLFLLGAGRDASTDGNAGYTNYATENYRVSTYFRDATARYGGTSVANVTDYARASGAYWNDDYQSSLWWSRSGGSSRATGAYCVTNGGNVLNYNAISSDYCVRPCFCLNLA